MSQFWLYRVLTAASALAMEGHAPAQVPAGLRTERNLAYGAPESFLKLDLYLPAAPERRLPVVVWIHGGGWRAGSKERPPALGLTAAGYAVASIDFRPSSEAPFPAQLEDCRQAIRWLRANAPRYGLDPGRIGVWGASSGGHLAALLGACPAEGAAVQAVVDFFGPTDFLRMSRFPGRIDHDAPDSPESLLIGGPIQENPERARAANPVRFVTGNEPPFLIMHGDRDPLVPLDQSRLLHEALRKAGVPSEFEIVRGAGHGFGGPEIAARIRAFFDHWLQRP